jgi:hypothetical protein
MQVIELIGRVTYLAVGQRVDDHSQGRQGFINLLRFL